MRHLVATISMIFLSIDITPRGSVHNSDWGWVCVVQQVGGCRNITVCDAFKAVAMCKAKQSKAKEV